MEKSAPLKKRKTTTTSSASSQPQQSTQSPPTSDLMMDTDDFSGDVPTGVDTDDYNLDDELGLTAKPPTSSSSKLVPPSTAMDSSTSGTGSTNTVVRPASINPPTLRQETTLPRDMKDREPHDAEEWPGCEAIIQKWSKAMDTDNPDANGLFRSVVEPLGLVVGNALAMFCIDLKNSTKKGETLKRIKDLFIEARPLINPNFMCLVLAKEDFARKGDLRAWKIFTPLALSVALSQHTYTAWLLKLKRIDPCLGVSSIDSKFAESPLYIAVTLGNADQVEALLRSPQLDPNFGKRDGVDHIVPLAECYLKISTTDPQDKKALNVWLDIADQLVADPRVSVLARYNGNTLKGLFKGLDATQSLVDKMKTTDFALAFTP